MASSRFTSSIAPINQGDPFILVVIVEPPAVITLGNHFPSPIVVSLQHNEEGKSTS